MSRVHLDRLILCPSCKPALYLTEKKISHYIKVNVKHLCNTSLPWKVNLLNCHRESDAKDSREYTCCLSDIQTQIILSWLASVESQRGFGQEGEETGLATQNWLLSSNCQRPQPGVMKRSLPYRQGKRVHTEVICGGQGEQRNGKSPDRVHRVTSKTIENRREDYFQS